MAENFSPTINPANNARRPESSASSTSSWDLLNNVSLNFLLFKV